MDWKKIEIDTLELHVNHTACTWKKAPCTVFFYGGSNDNNEYHNYILAYDMLLQKLSRVAETGEFPEKRKDHTCCVYGDCMYIFAGQSENRLLNDLYAYNFVTKKWTKIDQQGDVPSGRWGHAVAVDEKNQRMLLFGGCTSISGQTNFSSDFLEFSFKDHTWSKLNTNNGPTARRSHKCVVYKNEFYVVGGYPETNELWKFSFETSSWTQLSPEGEVFPPIHSFECVVHDDSMLVIGGQVKDGYVTSSIHEYNFSKNLWRLYRPEDNNENWPKPRKNHACAVENHQLILMGGKSHYQTSTYPELWTLSLYRTRDIKLVNDLKNIFNNKKNYDVIFMVGDKSRNETPKPVYAHKIIVSCRCKTLAKMLTKDTKKVEITDIPYKCFLKLMEYIYLGKVSITSDETMDLIAASEKLDLLRVRQSCYDLILNKLTKDTACSLLVAASEKRFNFDCDELVNQVVSYINRRTKDVVESEEFLKFDEKIILKLLQSNDICIDEYDLFKAISRWAKANETNQKTYKQLMEPFIPHIRLPLMSAEKLVQHIKPTNLFPLEQYMKAMEYHVSPKDVSTSGIWFTPRGSFTEFTWNNKVVMQASKNFALSDNDKRVEKIGLNNWSNCFIFGSKAYSSGTHYWEIRIDKMMSPTGLYIGVTADPFNSYYSRDICFSMSGSRYNCNSTKGTLVAKVGDHIGVLLDFRASTVYFFKNGIYSGYFGTLQSGKKYTAVAHMYYQKDILTLRFPNKVPKPQ